MGQYACPQGNSIFKSHIVNERCFYLALLSNGEHFVHSVHHPGLVVK